MSVCAKSAGLIIVTKPTTPDAIMAMDDRDRDVYLYGFMLPKVPESDIECVARLNEWQPSKPTERGKAQCWDLAERFHCWPKMRNGEYVIFVTREIVVQHKNPQVVVVTARIMCELAKQGKDNG